MTKTSVGVIVNKRVGNRIIPKRINLRVEHVSHSKCRQEFLDRVKTNAAKRKEAKTNGSTSFWLLGLCRCADGSKRAKPLVQVSVKRLPAAPRQRHYISAAKTSVETITPVPYESLL